MKNIYECHCHIALDGEDFRNAAAKHKNGADIKAVRAALEVYKASDVSYIRDGGDKWGASKAAAEIAEEYAIEYATPVFPIHKKGNYGSFIGKSFETIADFRRMVDEVKASGGDFIKIMASGIMDFSCFGKLTGWELPLEELCEMVKISHGEGFPVMVHVNGSDGVKRCVEAGADSVEHGNYMDEAALKCLADSSCVWVPTVSATTELMGKRLFPEDMLQRILEMQIKNIQAGVKMGIQIAAGSDAGAKCVYHGSGIMNEITFLSSYADKEKLSAAQEKLRQTFKHQV